MSERDQQVQVVNEQVKMLSNVVKQKDDEISNLKQRYEEHVKSANGRKYNLL